MQVAAILTLFMLRAATTPEAPEDSRALLEKSARWRADPCDAPSVADESEAPEVESRLRTLVENRLLTALNSPASKPGELPSARATRVLRDVQSQSATLNAAWPEENRFQGRLMEVAPLLVAELSFRSHAHFMAFAPVKSGKGATTWKPVGSESQEAIGNSIWTSLTLYPLHRGPGGAARFLARFSYTGCAGSTGVLYDAREFDPSDPGDYTSVIIQQLGAFGLEEVKPFRPIGKLVTDGDVLQLPYCWFSDLDNWDNPSLCALDSYLLSGDDVIFQKRSYNRPDLVPLARALEFAAKHELAATRAYCDSDGVAQRLVSALPMHGGELEVVHHGPDAETVHTGGTRFELRRHQAGWRVAGFQRE